MVGYGEKLMEDSEYIQDEGETVDLVVWEEYVRCGDWEGGVLPKD